MAHARKPEQSAWHRVENAEELNIVVRFFLGAFLAWPLACQAVPVATSSEADCLSKTAAEERQQELPPRLLSTISIMESGRVDASTHTVAPWPWTIDVAGTGYFYTTKQDAIVAVRAFQAAGIRSIDVGCMQINLLYHPSAFASLDEAFDPASNVRYGAKFLNLLHRQSGDWQQAIAAYHSQTPEIGAGYRAQILARWGSTPLSAGPGAAKAAAVIAANADYTPEFAVRMREMAEDHRRNVAKFGAADPTSSPAAKSRSRVRLAALP